MPFTLIGTILVADLGFDRPGSYHPVYTADLTRCGDPRASRSNLDDGPT